MLATTRNQKTQDPPLEPSERVQPCQHLDFGLLAYRTMRQYISVLLSHSLWELVAAELRETHTVHRATPETLSLWTMQGPSPGQLDPRSS